MTAFGGLVYVVFLRGKARPVEIAHPKEPPSRVIEG
jgi:hypothetical protein